MTWHPHVTVAAVVQDRGRFLLVEERLDGRLVYNQPAGHLEDGEDLTEAVARETLEETGSRFAPTAVTGVYLWRRPDSGETFLRVAFAGRIGDPDPAAPADEDVTRTVWLSRGEIADRADRLRSPMVLRAVDDFLAGSRYPLELLKHLDGGAVPDTRPGSAAS